MTNTYKSIQMFKNPLLEKFTHVHPLTPLVCWGPGVIFLLWQTFSEKGMNWKQGVGLMAAGLLSWTLMEYLLHRFLFHFEGSSKFSKKIHFLLHGHHHVDGNDPTRLVMTPIISVVLAIIFYWSFQKILGSVLVRPFFAFFLVGYLAYDYIHYYVHFSSPTFTLGKYLKKYHMMHHYVGARSRWGVSSPLWDYVFRTAK